MNEEKYTYLILSDYINPKIVGNMFNKKYWKPYQLTKNGKNGKNCKNNKTNYVDFVYFDGKYRWDRRLWNLKTNIYSAMGDEVYSVGDKAKLYDNFVKISPKLADKYMMKQYKIDLLDKNNIDKLLKGNTYKNIFKDNTTWILKPVDGFKGYGIKVVDNYNDMIEHLLTYKNKNDRYQLRRLKGSKPWVISKYIDNPLLFDGKKFHIRLNLMYFIKKNNKNNNNKNNNNSNNSKNKITKGFLFKGGAIVRARNKFVSKNYHNKNIHDTHHIVGDEIKFPEGFIKQFGINKTNKVMNEIINISNIIFKILDNNNANCFPNNNNCFNMFGIDIMIDNNFNVKILECNSQTGLIEYNIEEYFRNIIDITVGDLYPETL